MKTTRVLPDAESFAAFGRVMMRRGFRKISSPEFQRDFLRLGLEAPSPREGRELGFTCTANGLEVVVWTTFLPWEGRARESDCGWILIKDGDRLLYCRPVRRGKKFLYRLLWHSCIAKRRVEYRPQCPKCGARMRIVYGKGLKARFWKCVRPEFHMRAVSRAWDYELPQEAIDFLQSARKRRRRYAAELRKQGKKPGAALLKRKGWGVRRPENLIPAR